MKLSRLFISGWMIAAAAVALGAQAADTPSVDGILAKYVTAMGGKAAMEKVTSRVMKMKIESESFGTSEGEVYAKAPNKQASHIELAGGAGTMDEGFDGTVSWSKSPWEGLRVKSGDELAKAKRDFDFYRELKLKTVYPDLAYKGTEKVGEEEALVLETKPTATYKEKFWFSAKSGLVLRRDSEYEGPQGAVVSSVLPVEYKTVDGLKYPAQMKMKFSAGGQTMEFTLKVVEVQHNVKVDDAKFAKPAA